jgi:hypothetical protein
VAQSPSRRRKRRDVASITDDATQGYDTDRWRQTPVQAKGRTGAARGARVEPDGSDRACRRGSLRWPRTDWADPPSTRSLNPTGRPSPRPGTTPTHPRASAARAPTRRRGASARGTTRPSNRSSTCSACRPGSPSSSTPPCATTCATSSRSASNRCSRSSAPPTSCSSASTRSPRCTGARPSSSPTATSPSPGAHLRRGTVVHKAVEPRSTGPTSRRRSSSSTRPCALLGQGSNSLAEYLRTASTADLAELRARPTNGSPSSSNASPIKPQWRPVTESVPRWSCSTTRRAAGQGRPHLG